MKVPLQKTFFFNKPSCVKNYGEKLSRLVELLTTKQTCQPLGTITVLHKSKQTTNKMCAFVQRIRAYPEGVHWVFNLFEH